ncbi:MAG: hypothetical protein A3E85_00725 [Gammaproteobacteria bacterium RIFCSPHIGHO2_12_FULL_45_12]|nr:MAG: hypothetical protein A3E85_00725 [Gammaproteobacteria bacterium RIFCSPHIGHO2_12_FULL_45_12]
MRCIPAIPAEHIAMGDSKGGDRGSPPFGASKSVAFAQHKNKEAIPAFFSGNDWLHSDVMALSVNG